MDRDTLMEIVVALGGAVVFIAALLLVGTTFGDGGLSRQGGRAIVGVIALFILLMTGAGYLLSRMSG